MHKLQIPLISRFHVDGIKVFFLVLFLNASGSSHMCDSITLPQLSQIINCDPSWKWPATQIV